MTEKITFNLGGTVEEADGFARNLAKTLYDLWPVNNPFGQTGKNSFVEEFLSISGRAQDMAREVLGIGERKPVLGEPEDTDDDNAPEYPNEADCTCCPVHG